MTVLEPHADPVPGVAAALEVLVAAVQPHLGSVQTGRTSGRVRVDLEGQVGLELDETDLLDVVNGRADLALLLLAGRLAVTGDASGLIEVGARVRLPSGRPLVDPRALDPTAVSAAIAGVGAEHLDAVMAGPFRPVVLGEVFARLPEFLRQDKAAGVRLAVAFEVGGRTDGQVDRYVVRVADGACEVTADPAGEYAAAATLVLSGAQFLRLLLGHLNPVRGVLGGEVTVRGELMKALAFNSVMRIPGI